MLKGCVATSKQVCPGVSEELWDTSMQEVLAERSGVGNGIGVRASAKRKHQAMDNGPGVCSARVEAVSDDEEIWDLLFSLR